MCGLNGMVFLKGVKRDEATMNAIRFVFNELMVESQDRGHHATGIASFKRDGSFELYKKDKEAELMTTNDADYLNIISGFDSEQSSIVIAHTRYLTKGKADNNNNNHPFDIESVVGVHNGSVKNDDLLFKEYNFKRIGEVDSEIVYQLINHYNKEGITLDGLKKALVSTRMRGLFALAFVHKNNPDLLHLVKQDKPLSIAYWEEAGVMIFNSVGEYIEKAFRKMERMAWAFGGSAKQKVEIKTVLSNRYLTISANADNPKDAVSDLEPIYIISSDTTKWDYSSKWSDTDYGVTTTGKKSVIAGAKGAGTSGGSTTKTVTAHDSKGLELVGDIDTVTGEITIRTSNKPMEKVTTSTVSASTNTTNLPSVTVKKNNVADEMTTVSDEPEMCIDCGGFLDESEIEASYNALNPSSEKVCKKCWAEASGFVAKEELGVAK